jgi:hypothetical protein
MNQEESQEITVRKTAENAVFLFKITVILTFYITKKVITVTTLILLLTTRFLLILLQLINKILTETFRTLNHKKQ